MLIFLHKNKTPKRFDYSFSPSYIKIHFYTIIKINSNQDRTYYNIYWKNKFFIFWLTANIIENKEIKINIYFLTIKLIYLLDIFLVYIYFYM